MNAPLPVHLTRDDAASALAVVAKGSPRAKLRFHMDPVSAFAEVGGAPRSVEEHLSLAANTAARHAGAYPEATFFLASGRVAHEAGGSAAQELAFAASSVVAHAKAAVEAGHQWRLGTTAFGPYVGAEQVRLRSDGFDERGGDGRHSDPVHKSPPVVPT